MLSLPIIIYLIVIYWSQIITKITGAYVMLVNTLGYTLPYLNHFHHDSFISRTSLVLFVKHMVLEFIWECYGCTPYPKINILLLCIHVCIMYTLQISKASHNLLLDDIIHATNCLR